MKRRACIFGLIAAAASVSVQGGDRFYPSSTIYDKPQSIATYVLTQSQARRAVLAYVEDDCIYYEKRGQKPHLPYRATFERALAGDFAALRRIFTERNYHSGDNEDWIDTHWAILHAVGDERFAAFLLQLTPKERDGVLMYLRYSIKVPEPEFWRYFDRHFPHVAPIYRRYIADHRNA